MKKAEFERIVDAVRASPGVAAKADIGLVAERLGLAGAAVPVGDDCAAIPDGDGHLLFAIEGFINGFVAADPWFAGWCGVMVNLSDIAAMGGRPLAIVDAVWADGEAKAGSILDGLRAAAEAYGVPIVGGHSNLRNNQSQLAVAVLGRANKHLLTSFDARPGDLLLLVADHRGAYREPFDNFEAALEAPPKRLRGDLELMAEVAERGLARAAKDVSQGGYRRHRDRCWRRVLGLNRARSRPHRAPARRFVGALVKNLSELRLFDLRIARAASTVLELFRRAGPACRCYRRGRGRFRSRPDERGFARRRARSCGRKAARPRARRRMSRLRVAMLTHSTLPRGGVVHAMNLGEALTALGAETVLHAPDAEGAGFFRA